MILQNESLNDDQLLLDQAIAEFLHAESAGGAGERQQWLDRFPQCAEGLLEFFADRERVDRIMTPLRMDPLAAVPEIRDTDVFKLDPHATIENPNLDTFHKNKWGARYRPLGFHARGGMGEIWLAEDERIGRRVAVKTLRRGYYMEPARFLVEAQVTGQLEHPSVVPLHDMGIDDGGQPFYVMKFVHGRKLRQAIGDYHASKSRHDWPSDVEFRRLLETFIDVCNVVAYAHHKGVLHRDIKPDNVMLGPYGETVVLDWGLAKVVGQPEEVHGSFVRLSGGDSTATQDGVIVGSPYYMSPEGAEGHPEAVDQASDVYLLGATLYEILTATPPRQGSSNTELIDLARNSMPTNPRKVDRRIPRALEAICLKAMAFRKQDRYESPLAVAADIERYLAGAPAIAYHEPFFTRMWRWLRRHRRGVVRALMALVLLAVASIALRSYRQARELSIREEAREQLGEFHRLADETQFFAANSDAISERVPYYDPRRAKIAGDAALEIAKRWGKQAEELPIVEARAEVLESQYALLLLMTQNAIQASENSPDAQLAFTLLDQAHAIHQPTRRYYQLRSRCLTLVGERDAAEREQLRAEQKDTLVIAQDHFLQAESLRLQDSGASAQVLSQLTEPRREHLANAIDEYRSALRLDPRHYWARFQLGRCLFAIGRAPESIEALSACIAIRPESPWAYSARGLAKALSGNAQDAVDDLNQAILRDPNFQPARLNRGVVHWINNDAKSAIVDFDAVLKAPADKRLIEAAFYRGQLLSSERRDTDALADFSTVINARPDFRQAYWFRAKTEFRLEKFADGLSDLKKFITLERRQPNVEKSFDERLSLGKALRKMGQELDGQPRRQLLIAAAKQLQAGIDAGEPKPDFYEHLGAVHDLRGDRREAIIAYSLGLKLAADNITMRNMRAWAYVNDKQYEKASEDFVESLRLQPTNPEAHAGLGFVLVALDRADAGKEASAAWLAGANNHLVLHNIACVYGRLSDAKPEKRIEYENLALAALERAAMISRQNPLGPDSDEQELIRRETSFPASLRDRQEFRQLLKGKTNNRR